MKALRFYDQRDLRLEEIPPPSPKEGEVLIKVKEAGISQTQINEFVEGPFIINKEPHPLTNLSTPLIPSQEYGGVVVEVGRGVDPSWRGKRVAVLPLLSCKSCSYCKKGLEHLCSKMAYYGLLGANGGFCEYSVVKSENIFEIEKDELFTFVEPLLVAIHAAHRVEKYQDKGSVLVLGAGAIGISVAAVFSDYFGYEVFLNDILPNRFLRAKRAGFNTLEKREIKKESFDIVIDAAGMDTLVERPAIIEAIDYLKRGGLLLNIGTYFHPLSFIPSNMLLKEQTLLESFAYNSKDVALLDQVIDALQIDFKEFIEYLSLENIIEDGYYRAEVDKDSFTRLSVRI